MPRYCVNHFYIFYHSYSAAYTNIVGAVIVVAVIIVGAVAIAGVIVAVIVEFFVKICTFLSSLYLQDSKLSYRVITMYNQQ